MVEERYMRPALDNYPACNSLEMNKEEEACNRMVMCNWIPVAECSK